MSFRRITLTLGATAGGMFAVAFFPMAVAFADASDASAFNQFFEEFFGFQQDTSVAPTFYSVTGELPIFQDVHLAESFTTDPTGTLPAGSFQVDNEVITTPFGPASSELLVTSSDGGPPVGSVYDVIDIGHGYENVYSDIAPTTPGGTDTLSDTLVTPFGNIPIKTGLHAYLDPAHAYYLYNTMDPSAAGATDPLAVTSVNDESGANAFFDQLFGEFYGFNYDASQPTTVTDIAAIPPFYQSVHQTEFFNTDATNTLPAGSFQADDNILWNTKGPSFSEILVTSSEKGTSAPPVGSVYEINNMGHGYENLYSDIAPTTPGGSDTLSDILVTPSGNIPMPTALHAFFDPTDKFFPYDTTDPSAATSPQLRLRANPSLSSGSSTIRRSRQRSLGYRGSCLSWTAFTRPNSSTPIPQTRFRAGRSRPPRTL